MYLLMKKKKKEKMKKMKKTHLHTGLVLEALLPEATELETPVDSGGAVSPSVCLSVRGSRHELTWVPRTPAIDPQGLSFDLCFFFCVKDELSRFLGTTARGKVYYC